MERIVANEAVILTITDSDPQTMEKLRTLWYSNTPRTGDLLQRQQVRVGNLEADNVEQAIGDLDPTWVAESQLRLHISNAVSIAEIDQFRDFFDVTRLHELRVAAVIDEPAVLALRVAEFLSSSASWLLGPASTLPLGLPIGRWFSSDEYKRTLQAVNANTNPGLHPGIAPQPFLVDASATTAAADVNNSSYYGRVAPEKDVISATVQSIVDHTTVTLQFTEAPPTGQWSLHGIEDVTLAQGDEETLTREIVLSMEGHGLRVESPVVLARPHNVEGYVRLLHAAGTVASVAGVDPHEVQWDDPELPDFNSALTFRWSFDIADDGTHDEQLQVAMAQGDPYTIDVRIIGVAIDEGVAVYGHETMDMHLYRGGVMRVTRLLTDPDGMPDVVTYQLVDADSEQVLDTFQDESSSTFDISVRKDIELDVQRVVARITYADNDGFERTIVTAPPLQLQLESFAVEITDDDLFFIVEDTFDTVRDSASEVRIPVELCLMDTTSRPPTW